MIIKVSHQIGWFHEKRNNYDETLKYYGKCLEIYKHLKNKNKIALILNDFGFIKWKQCDYSKSIYYFNEALVIFKEINNQKLIGICLSNIGLIYSDQSNYIKALEYFHKSLKIVEDIKDKYSTSNVLNNIGLVYNNQGEHDKAIEHYKKCLKIKVELSDTMNILTSLNNIGISYSNKKDYSKSFEYYNKILSMDNIEKYKFPHSICLLNIGDIYNKKLEYSKALEYYKKSLSIQNVIRDKKKICILYYSMASCYFQLHQVKKALDYNHRALKLAKELDILLELSNIYEIFSKIYFAKKNYKKSYENHKQFILLKDSIFNEENIKKITGLEYQYKYEKEKQAIALEQAKKDAISKEEIKRQKIMRNSFIIGFVLMLLLAALILWSLKQKKKANHLLTKQKKQIEVFNLELNQTNEKLNTTLKVVNQQKKELNVTLEVVNLQKEKIEDAHKNIKDSINYASRIQNAILPNLDIFEKATNDYFVFFKPRDVVSGDFYWAKQIGDYFIYITADCTGHGVPGAFVSMLGVSLLNEIVNKKEINQTNEVLDILREEMKKSLKQKGKNKNETKDGMDLTMCIINRKTNELQFSGANNSMYLYRNNELIEFKGNRQPIGIYIKEKPFTNYEIQLQENDVIYTFSDGYIDQFGGKKGKKFMKKRFKKLLLEINHKDMSEQKQILDKIFGKWKGNLNQIDDVLVIGVKI
ncbi:MAG: hypothetical protein B6I24_00930 [Bacteroidetes bacterium 4572_128]|nr:MAG: hypothetical protein B6I24_00930 [Bacteroidetes bacterium 4572_128]